MGGITAAIRTVAKNRHKLPRGVRRIGKRFANGVFSLTKRPRISDALRLRYGSQWNDGDYQFQSGVLPRRTLTRKIGRSNQDWFDHVAVDVGESEIATLKSIRESFVIDAE